MQKVTAEGVKKISILDTLLGNEVAEQKDEEPKEDLPPLTSAQTPLGTAFYTLEEFVVNLKSNRAYPVFLLLSLTIETQNEGVRPIIEAQEPRIRDAMIVYLSSLSPAELNGYAGIQRVRTKAWQVLRNLVDPELVLNVQITKLTVK